jgi:type III pantothenate kinase
MPKPVIAADIGNSAIKLGWLAGDGKFCHMRIESLDWLKALEIPAQPALPPSPCHWSVCSVAASKCDAISAWVRKHRPHDNFHRIAADEIPIESVVDQRSQVGRDRLLAAFMAKRLVQTSRPIVVVDAGTAVTIDLIDEGGVFQGGVIFPGARAQLRTLASTTHDLPELTIDSHLTMEILNSQPGKNTVEAMVRGVYRAQLAAIIGIAESYRDTCQVLATGGEIEGLRNVLPPDWRIEPFLILQAALLIGSQFKPTDR